MATVHTTAENFEKLIDQDGIVILDFWAPWCGPCRSFAPVFEAASEQHKDIRFGKINTDEEQALAGEFQISAIPTLMVFRDRVLVFSNPGALPGKALDELIGKVRELDMAEVHAQVAKAQAAAEEKAKE